MRFLLFPFALVYRLIIGIRNFLYIVGILKSKTLDVPVICVGNITTGGTGKTPWTQFLCNHFTGKGKKVVILSRGYKGDFQGVLKVDESMDPKVCGDEPLWLCRNTKASIYLSKDRYLGALEAIKKESPDLIILDDGFQHYRLKRVLDLVLLDASADKKQYRLLPVGNLREPFSNISRAGWVIINKCNYGNKRQMNLLKQKSNQFVDSKRIIYADYSFREWAPLFEGEQSSFHGEEIAICCGLGNPKAFVKTVEEQKLSISKSYIFPDHFYWKPEDIEKMTFGMKQLGIGHLLITEKDGVKLSRYKKHFQEMKIQLWVCKMDVLLKSDKESFLKAIEEAVSL